MAAGARAAGPGGDNRGASHSTAPRTGFFVPARNPKTGVWAWDLQPNAAASVNHAAGRRRYRAGNSRRCSTSICRLRRDEELKNVLAKGRPAELQRLSVETIIQRGR